MRYLFFFLLSAVVMLAAISSKAAAPDYRSTLIKGILSTNLEEQTAIVNKFVEVDDAFVTKTLQAWRSGEIYIQEEGEKKIPFILDPQLDSDGRGRGIKISDGEYVKDAEGKTAWFASFELVPADVDSKLRKVIKTTLDLYALSNPDEKMRRDAVIKLGQEQNPDYISYFKDRLTKEKVPEVNKALREAIALTNVAAEDKATRVDAINTLADLRSITSLSFLKDLLTAAEKEPKKYDQETVTASQKAVKKIESYISTGNFVGTGFRGLSLAAVLLVASLGLAITFGLMGVINMAHGELMMVGAYTAYVTQNLFKGWFGETDGRYDFYFIAALFFSFFTAALVGLILERGVIRFLYKRPLESLLATWGVSLVLQQLFRHIFGAANVQVSSPNWLRGSYVTYDVLFAYNRVFVIGFAVFIVFGTYLLLTKTSLGLQIRAVMQNRNMASCIGVRTDRVNMMTFAFGSGLAGMAGACLSQIGNVGPSLGQSYIVDCFMIVVLGGVGNLVGTVSAAFGVGVTDQILQPWLGAVLGKITVLGGIILFLQWRPSGLFATRSRSLEG